MYFPTAHDPEGMHHRGLRVIWTINEARTARGEDVAFAEPKFQFTDRNTGHWVEVYADFVFVQDDDGSDMIPLTPAAALELAAAARKTVVEPRG